ncbi:MAG: DUF4340 domain-containing protein [Pseudomonadota bacterium]
MSKQWVVVLALAILLGMGLIWLLDYSMPGDAEQENAWVLPAMSEQINDINALDIVAPGGAVAVSLRRVGEPTQEGQDSTLRWRVVQRDSFEADFARVFELLRDLAELQQTEARTSNPDWYARLGVQSVGESDASGRRLDFPLSAVPSLIVGQVDPTGQGSYVRVDDQVQSWLADRVLELPIDPVQWLEPSIMDIPASDIEQVIVRHPDGETVQIRNAGTENSDFVVLNVPEDRQAGPAFQRTALANGLRGLNLEDVQAFDGAVPDSAVRVLFTTNDGLNFVASVFEQATANDETEIDANASNSDSGYWIHFTVSAETTAVDAETADSAAPTLSADEEVASAPSEQAVSVDQQQENQRLVNAVAVDARLSPWLFRIPQRRFDDITPRFEDILEPLPETESEE